MRRPLLPYSAQHDEKIERRRTSVTSARPAVVDNRW
jgi:hypothetical protein